MDGVKNTLNRVVSAEFELPEYLSSGAKDLINCLLKKVCMQVSDTKSATKIEIFSSIQHSD